MSDAERPVRPVSRETSTPPVPDVARGVFAVDRLEVLERYVAALAGDGVVRGLIGPREAPRRWERHIFNCAVLADLVDAGDRVCDIGSGAGLPGLVLAIARPDVAVTLVEPLLRRTTFLDEVVADLELANVTVLRGRADALHGGPGFDVVTSRAVAPLPRLLDWSMPLVLPTGSLLALKGSSIRAEIAEAAESLASWRCAEPEVLVLEGPDGVEPTYAVRVRWADPGSVSLPPTQASTAQTRARSPRSGKRRSRRDR